MFKQNGLYKLILAGALLALVQMACNLSGSTATPTQAVGGVVQGAVYGDLNGNGVIDPGEGPLAGVQVSLAGCGPSQSQISAADGTFKFTGLPAGSCTVSVTMTGWHFSGSIPSLGYPIPVASDPALPTAFSIDMAPNGSATPATSVAPTAGVPTIVPPTSTLTPTDTLTPTITLTPLPYYTSTFTTVPGVVTNLLIAANPTSEGVVACFVIGGTPHFKLPAFQVSMTTNGPATVTYYLQIYSGGSMLNQTSNKTKTFASASTQTFTPGDTYTTGCGSYTVKVVVTSPNSRSAQAAFSIVQIKIHP
ncbi:MAG: SdrD B-like domain-containing protein [Anaerolineales bacterium]